MADSSELPHLAAVLKRRREILDLSQEELAHLSGMTMRHYQRLERGIAKNPTLTSLLAVAKALDVSLEILIEESRTG